MGSILRKKKGEATITLLHETTCARYTKGLSRLTYSRFSMLNEQFITHVEVKVVVIQAAYAEQRVYGKWR